MCGLVLDDSTACHSFHLLLQETEKIEHFQSKTLLAYHLPFLPQGTENSHPTECHLQFLLWFF